MQEESSSEFLRIRNQGTQPKYHDVYPELEARLFEGALDGQLAIVTGAGRGMFGISEYIHLLRFVRIR